MTFNLGVEPCVFKVKEKQRESVSTDNNFILNISSLILGLDQWFAIQALHLY